MKQIASLIHQAVTTGDADPDHAVSKQVRAEVTDLVTRFRHTLAESAHSPASASSEGR